MSKRRKRGEGSVHLRKDGHREGRLCVGYNEKGLPKTKSVLAKTKTECTQKLKELKKTLGETKPAPAKTGPTLGEWLDTWYQTYKNSNLRPNTQMSYEQRIYNHIIPNLGSIPLNKLTQNDLQQFYIQLKQSGRLLHAELHGEGLSDQTVRGCHTTLQAALDKAVSEKLIYRNPVNGCKLPSAKVREMKILTPEEIQRLFIQAKEDGCFEWFLLELSTGLRRGEILALQWNDLNFRTGELRIERQVHRVRGERILSQPKTRASNRSVILPPSVLTVLGQLKDTSDSRWMFPSPVKENSPPDPASVRKRLRTILDRAECKAIRFHDLRHTFSTLSLEHGMDVKTLSAIIGHVSSSTTLNIYAHITDAMRQNAALKIDQSIAKAKPSAQRTPSTPAKATRPTFHPYKGQRRKPGTGCLSQINDHLWEGRYSLVWPDGKKHPRNIYAKTREECEQLLAEMIVQIKSEISAEKGRRKDSERAS